MGTETNILSDTVTVINIQRVKLNNPLMGTETSCCANYRSRCGLVVKLNNPLMGTETLFMISWIINLPF